LEEVDQQTEGGKIKSQLTSSKIKIQRR